MKTKVITSEAYELIKQDVIKWARNAAIFLAPAVGVAITSYTATGDYKIALGAVLTWVANTLLDLYRKWAGEAQYKV